MAVEPARSPLPVGATVLDGRGRFLIPGLWDMHFHVAQADLSLPLLVAHGITGVRDMGNAFDSLAAWRRAIATGVLLGPRIVSGGPIVDGPDIIIPGARLNIATAGEAEHAVDSIARAGGSFIKVWSLVPRAAYFALLRAAARRGLPVVGHVPTGVTAVEAADSGQRSIEHLTNVLLAASSRGDSLFAARLRRVRPGTPEAPVRFLQSWFYGQAKALVATYDSNRLRAVAARFRARHTWITPTLVLWRGYAAFDSLERAGDPDLDFAVSDWKPKSIWFETGAPPEALIAERDQFALMVRVVGALSHSGVRILAGSDGPGFHNAPGSALVRELALLVQAGLSPRAAVAAATSAPADFLGLADSLGAVRPDMVADLVLLDADPFQAVENVGRVRAVIQAGRVLSRTALDTILDRARALARMR